MDREADEWTQNRCRTADFARLRNKCYSKRLPRTSSSKSLIAMLFFRPSTAGLPVGFRESRPLFAFSDQTSHFEGKSMNANRQLFQTSTCLPVPLE